MVGTPVCDIKMDPADTNYRFIWRRIMFDCGEVMVASNPPTL